MLIYYACATIHTITILLLHYILLLYYIYILTIPYSIVYYTIYNSNNNVLFDYKLEWSMYAIEFSDYNHNESLQLSSITNYFNNLPPKKDQIDIKMNDYLYPGYTYYFVLSLTCLNHSYYQCYVQSAPHSVTFEF